MSIYMTHHCVYPFISFHTSFHRWFFTGIWVTTSLLRFPGHLWLFLQILTVSVVWIVYILKISSSSSLFSVFLGIVPSASNTIGMTVAFICHHFFSFLVRFKYLSSFSHLYFQSAIDWQAKFFRWQLFSCGLKLGLALLLLCVFHYCYFSLSLSLYIYIYIYI